MQGYDVQKSTTSYPLVFLMVLSSDHITGATGLSPTVTLSKNGGSFASPSGAVTEIANGWYAVAGNATDTGTLGPLLLHATAATADPSDACFPVVAYNPQDAVHLGLTALPNTACTTNASLLTSGTGTDQVSVSSGKVLLQATQTGVTIPTVTTVTNQLTAAAIATGVWQDTTSGDFTTASSIGKCLYIANVVPGAAGGHFIAGTNAATTVTSSFTTTFTGNLTGSVGSVTGAVGSVTGAVGSVTGAVGSVTGSVGSISGITFPTNFSSTSIDTSGRVLLQPTQTGVTIPTVTTVTNQLTAAQVATGVWQDATGGDFTTASSIGKCLYIANVAPGAAGGHFIAGTNAATTITTGLTTTFTGNLTGSVGSVTGAVGSVTGAVGSVTATVAANVTEWGGTAVATPNVAGVPIVDVGYFAGAAAINGTAQAGTSTTITLASGDSAVDNYYKGQSIAIAAGTGAGQSRPIASYVGSTKVATISGTWATTPDSSSQYVIGSAASVDAAAIATAVWTDTTSGDFTTTSSPGKILVAQLGGAFTSTSSSVYSTASLVNAPSGGTAPTVDQIATAVWQDTTSGDFTTAGSIGKALFVSAIPGAAGGHFIAGTNAATTITTSLTTTFNGSLTGSVGSVTGAVASVTGAVGSVTGSVGSVTGAVGSVTGAVGSVTGSVGSISGVTFPTNFSSTSIDTSGRVLLQPTQTGVTIPTVTTVTNQLTAAAIATGVWQDTTSGDFTTTSSPGKILVAQLGGAFTTTSSSIYSTASLANAPTGSGGPTAAQIATAVWQDTTSGDFTTDNSPGKIVVAQLGGAFTTSSSSIYSTASLVNAPTGGSAPTAAQIATAVWTDTTSGDFTTTGSPGKILVAQLGGAFTTSSSSVYSTASLVNAPFGSSVPTVSQIATAVWQDATGGDFTTAGSIGKALFVNAIPGAAGGHFIAGSNAATTVNITGNLSGSVGSVTAAVTANVTEWGGTNVAGAIPPDVVFIHSGTAQGGAGGSITLDADASSMDNLYSDQIVFIRSGTGAGQSAIISAYNGTTKVATIVGSWATNPDDTSVFTLLPFGSITTTVPGGVNVTQWNGVDVAAPNVDGVPVVDLAYTKGTTSTGTAGYVGIDWANVHAPTTSVALTGTTISTSQAVASVTSGVTLTSSGLDAVVVETGLNARQSLSVIASAVAGVGGTATSTYAGAGVSTNRITYQASGGTRTVVNLSPPA